MVREKEERSSREGKSRRSKDAKINKEGRNLIDLVEERGWSIFNGNMNGDEEGKFIFTGKRKYGD